MSARSGDDRCPRGGGRRHGHRDVSMLTTPGIQPITRRHTTETTDDMRRTTTLHSERSGTGPAPRPDRQNLQIATADDGALVVAGDLDAASADVMDRALRDAEEGRDPAPIVVDLRGVAFMDSSGLRTLVAASLRAGRRGSRVALRNVGPELSRLLEITGLCDQFGLPNARPADRAWRLSDAHVSRDDHPNGRRG